MSAAPVVASVGQRAAELASRRIETDERSAQGSLRAQRAASRDGFSPFWPVLVFFVVWLAWALFQGYQLNEERKGLIALKDAQQQQVVQAQRVRQTLDTLAAETQKLADTGNANARLVIEELRKRGVTVTLPAAQAGPGK